MTFPSFAVGRGNSGGDVTSQTISFDSSPSAGDLLIAAIVTDSSSSTLTWPAIFADNMANLPTAAGSMQMNIRRRIADGTEGASFDVSISPSNALSWQVYRVTGHLAATAPTGSTPSGGLDANPDPPNCDPAATEDNLWLAFATVNDGDVTVNSYPTNYINGIRDGSGGAGGVTIASATRELNASSENPGTFTLSSAAFAWIGYTIGVRPAAASGDVFFENRHPISQGMKPQTASGMGGVLIDN